MVTLFSKRLKQLREERDYSMVRLIEEYNKKYNAKMNKSTLSRYENGLQAPIYTVVVNFADFFNVSVDYLTGSNNIQITQVDIYENPKLKQVKLVKFPLLGEIACGKPMFANEDRESYIMADMDIQADFCLVAKGDSMINARVNNGDIVFIREMPIVNNGEIAAVIIDNEVTLKRVYYYPESNKLVLNAENPNYQPLVYVGEELDNIRILGKAVYFMSAL